jgi:hypothetical protein
MKKIIVSLTTISHRINILEYVLKSLLTQSLLPDKIYVNISKGSYLLDEGVAAIPSWLINLELNGIVVVNEVENIGPYRKLIPVIKYLEPEDYIVICDDDVIYSKNWLRDLYDIAINSPSTVVCYYAKEIKRLPYLNLFRSYIYWPTFYGKAMHNNILPVGVGGVLYRVDHFDLSKLLDKKFLLIAPFADDLWFWASCKPNLFVHVINPDPENSFHTITSSINLFEINYSQNKRCNFAIVNKIQNLFGWFGYKATQNDAAFGKITSSKFNNENIT